MSNLSVKINPKLAKVIKRFPTKVQVFRVKLDAFKEPIDEVPIITDLEGFYHEDNGYRTRIVIEDKGTFTSSPKGKYVMVIATPEVLQIQEEDILYICDDNNKIIPKERYVINDTGNLNRLGIYCDLNIKEAPGEMGRF
ncbi:MAG: hypothetical protein ACRCR2_03715 [Fusobacteriaceae bacterium]